MSGLLQSADGIPARKEWPDRLEIAGPNTSLRRVLISAVNWFEVRQVPSEKLKTFLSFIFSFDEYFAIAFKHLIGQ
jgi:hypothetical protein